jgi:plasmid stabilization system protein ParE
MSLSVVWRPEAEVDLLTARDWYEWQSSGLGDEFADAVETMVARIETMPELYAIALEGVRRGKLRKFPYLIYYRLLLNQIEVLAVLHTSRDPAVWQNRI